MGRRSRLERALRRGLLIVLIALAAAVLWLWLARGPGRDQTFARIYQVSLAQATGNFTLEAALGVPLEAARADASYHFYRAEGRNHVRFRFPLRGPRGAAVIEGEAVQIGRNWLIVHLVARFPLRGGEINLSPNIRT